MTIIYEDLPSPIPLTNQVVVENLMTSLTLLEQSKFIAPSKILPDKFTDFDSILEVRDAIKNLRLLPVKHDIIRSSYKEIKNSLVPSIKELIKNSKFNIAYQENQYPYFLPADLVQGIVWIFDDFDENSTKYLLKEKDIIKFIAGLLIKFDVNSDKVIIFERSRKTETLLVKGSFPQIRHIHLWTKRSF